MGRMIVRKRPSLFLFDAFDSIGLGYNVVNVRNETHLFVNEDIEIFCFVLPGDVLTEHGDVPYRALTTFRDKEWRTFIGIVSDEPTSALLLQRISGRL